MKLTGKELLDFWGDFAPDTWDVWMVDQENEAGVDLTAEELLVPAQVYDLKVGDYRACRQDLYPPQVCSLTLGGVEYQMGKRQAAGEGWDLLALFKKWRKTKSVINLAVEVDPAKLEGLLSYCKENNIKVTR